MKVYNTLTRSLEEFRPLENERVRMYTCGPTVYDFAHVGNFRAYVFEDLLRRYLEFCGYEVFQVMNLTDVDDKTIRGARERGLQLSEYTAQFKAAFFEDLETLNIRPAAVYPAATDHVPEMIDLVQTLLDKGYAYRSSDGSVYFSIGKVDGYGKLAKLDLSGLRAGARVAADEYGKEDAGDFALWKAWDEEDGNVAWDAPWGRGRPGWHIECSAMSMKYLGPSFDIHTGGMDNIFPHHEDEIAQSEAATGKPLAAYWMHCAHLVVDGRKMSKSLGNFFTLRDILDRGYAGREIRYVLASAQYRQALNFTFQALDGARAALQRVDAFRARLREARGSDRRTPAWALRGARRFADALDEDLNVAESLGALFDMIHDGNRALDAGAWSGDGAAVEAVLGRMDSVLGFLEAPPEKVDGEAQSLAEQRERARRERRWADADRIRDRLKQMGWDVQDTSGGFRLKRADA